jgi:TonB family protein
MVGEARSSARPLLKACVVLSLVAPLIAQVTPGRVRVSERVSQALIVKKVTPAYPQPARKELIQGKVVLTAEINVDGDVEQVVLVSGHPWLAPAAVDAVKQWKYKPYLLNGRPVPIESQVSVSFVLEPPEKTDGEPSPSVVIASAPPDVQDTGAVVAGIVNSAPVVKPTVALPQRIRVASGVSQTLILKKVNPEYPDDARRARIQGTVVLTIVISKEGNVAETKLISGHELLVPAAMDAVKQWKYKPYLLQGTPVEVETLVQINFTLSGG